MRVPTTLRLSIGRAILALAALVMASLAARPAAAGDAVHFLGALTLPDDAKLAGTTIGGLSGIAYNDSDDAWYFISDDKAEHGPARYYAADIILDGDRLASVRFKAMTPLKQASGETYSAATRDTPDGYVDPEAIAYTGRGIIWTSEGSAHPFVQNMITSAAIDGTVLRRYELPPGLVMDEKQKKGPRPNKGLEALAVAPDGALWLGLEAPLYQDGDLPDTKDGAVVRLTKLGRNSGNVGGQYAYRLAPLRHAALPGKQADGPGLSEMVALDDRHLLTLERSWVEGVTNYVQIYLVDLKGATDVSDIESLRDQKYEPVKKRLVLDLNTLGIRMDNYEGMALGPTLPDGRRLMVLCVDNNFNRKEKTTIAAFSLDTKALLTDEKD